MATTKLMLLLAISVGVLSMIRSSCRRIGRTALTKKSKRDRHDDDDDDDGDAHYEGHGGHHDYQEHMTLNKVQSHRL